MCSSVKCKAADPFLLGFGRTEVDTCHEPNILEVMPIVMSGIAGLTSYPEIMPNVAWALTFSVNVRSHKFAM